jgi:hypothetical protein
MAFYVPQRNAVQIRGCSGEVILHEEIPTRIARALAD